MGVARSACQDGTGLNQRTPHGLAINPHALRDRPHRDTAEVESYRFSRLFYSESRTAKPAAVPREVRRHGGAMYAVPVCQLVDRRTVEVVVNEAVNLSGGEKGLKMFNPPNHSAPRVLHRGGFRALGHPVNATLPACDQGV